MSTTSLNRDPFKPRQPKGRGKALALAIFAHVLLIAGLAFGVHWRSSEPTTMAAELWSAVPQAAAPRAAEPPPTPTPEVKKPTPVVKPAEPVAPPKPQAPPAPDPQIAIEKAKREEAKREKAEKEKAEREETEREKQRAKDEAQKKAAAEKQKAEKDKADTAARQEAVRTANLKRIQGMADATGGPTDTGTALRASGPSASYAGRIMARIKPNIVFNEQVDGNPIASVEVTLAPDGTIVAKRLLKSSGVKSWDNAVLRAIERTEVLPRDVDGRVPPPFPIDFKLRD